MKTYQELLRDQRLEVENFEGIFFAFNNDQLEAGLKKVGADSTKDIMSLGAGGYILKSKEKDFDAMFERHKVEREKTFNNEKELFDALVYELCNHEYCITYNPHSALSALGLSSNDVNPTLLDKACKQALADSEA